MNWDDPVERLRLAESVGHEEYNRLVCEHLNRDVVSVVNGYGIRPVMTRFGRLFAVNGTTKAFSTQQRAEDFARTLTTGGAL